MSVLLTGGAGFIGSHLCERLLTGSFDVVSLDSYDDFYNPKIKRHNLDKSRDYDCFTEVEGDVRDLDTLDKIPEVDKIIHLAALAGVRPSIENPLLYQDVNIGGTLAILEFARKRNIRHVIFGSSSSVYGNSDKVPFSEYDSVDRPISPYAATKKSGELLCHNYNHLYGLGVLCLRFFTVYGPRQRPDLAIHKFSRLMIAEELIPKFGDGTTERDYTYVDDIIQGVVAALGYLENHPEAYEIINLGNSCTVSLNEMISTVSRALSVTPNIEELPMQPGDALRTYADISKARNLLNYDPQTDFEDGVQKFVEWFLEWH
jgi:UDP-glucuronate 4-epimerase